MLRTSWRAGGTDTDLQMKKNTVYLIAKKDEGGNEFDRLASFLAELIEKYIEDIHPELENRK